MVTISVIVPTNDRPRLLVERCLWSLLSQTFGDWEAIVVGEPGSPETVEAMASIEDRRIGFHSVPRPWYPDDVLHAWAMSWYAAVPYGLQRARGEWVTVLCDDDELLPHAFESLLAKADGVDFVYGLNERRIGDHSYVMGADMPPRFDDHALGGYIQRRATIGHIQPDVASIQRGFTPDGEWWKRIFDEVRYARVPEVLHIYHQDPARLHWGPAFYGKEPRP